jgi:putative hydrolase of the HAD superfamily
MLSDVEAVLFDMGGTLVDYPIPSWPILFTRCAQGMYGYLVRPEGERPPPAAAFPDPAGGLLRPTPTGPDTALAHRAMVALRRIVRSLSDRTLPHMAEACARPLTADGKLYDDTLPTLGELRARGYRLGLVSNTPWGTPEYLWVSQLDRFGLTAWFEVRIFSSHFGVRKPNPRIFQAALDALGVAAPRAVFVGDNPRADIAGAARLGMRSVLIARPGWNLPRVTKTPDLTIETLSDLLAHLPAAAKK